MKLFIILFFSFLASSCSMKQPFELYGNQVERNSGKGVILCSVIHGRNGIGRPDPSYYIRRIGSTDKIRIFGHNKLFEMTSDVKDDAGPGVIKVLELPAGNYEIFTWDLFFNLGMIQWHEYPKAEFSIPFEIKPDSLNYLGQFTLKGYFLSFADRIERDLEITYSRNDSLRLLTIYKQDLKCVEGCEWSVEKKDSVFHMPMPVRAK